MLLRWCPLPSLLRRPPSAFLLTCLMLGVARGERTACPTACRCSPYPPGGAGIMVDCSGRQDQLPLQSLDGLRWPDNTRKLNLSWNELHRVEPHSFDGLVDLEILDLSHNQLEVLRTLTVSNLLQLKHVHLNNNHLWRLEEGALQVATTTKVWLDNNPLVCNCHSRWLQTLTLSRNTVCNYPDELRGKTLAGTLPDNLHCDWPLRMDVFTLTPSVSQVVFEGDKLPFTCQASLVDGHTLLHWQRLNTSVTNNETQGVFVTMLTADQDGTVTSFLLLKRLKVADSGQWQCVAETPRGNRTLSVNIVVMSLGSLYCQANTTATNKGVFAWARTVQGTPAELPCPHGSVTTGNRVAVARHSCSSAGEWQQLDTAQCQYQKELTTFLQHYAQTVNSNGSSSLDWNKVQQTIPHLVDPTRISDVDEVHFMAQIAEGLLDQLYNKSELAETVLSVVSLMVQVDAGLMGQAQKQYRAASRLVTCVEQLSERVPPSAAPRVLVTDNLAVYHQTVDRAGVFPGLVCAYTGPLTAALNQSSWRCGDPTNQTVQESSLSAAITIPSSLLESVRCLYPDCAPSSPFLLTVVFYRGSGLFPWFQPSRRVTTPVISATIANASVDASVDPFIIHLLSSEAGIHQEPVYWDFKANSGRGTWINHGCELQDPDGLLYTVKCHHLTNFAVSQEPLPKPSALSNWLHSLKVMSPIVYTGSALLTISLILTLVTYTCCHRHLQLARRFRHCVANLCLALLLLTVTFTLGVRVKEPALMCKLVGVVLHYLSLSTLLWMAVASYTSYKKLARKDQPPITLDEEGEQNTLGSKPILGLYLIGWGLGLILCGIIAAINNMHHYTHPEYCFLEPSAQIFAFFLPAAILVMLSVLFCIGGLCALRHLPSSPTLPDAPLLGSSGTGTERSESDSIVPTVASTSERSTGQLSGLSSQLDGIYQPRSQLKGLLGLLALVGLSWASGLLTVALPLEGRLHHQQILFNYLYAFACVGLGVYLLAFLVFGRRDGRRAWAECRWAPKEEPGEEGGGEPGRYSPADSLSNYLRSADLYSYHSAPPSDVFTEQGTASAPDYPIFYNPRQNGIARKYWERNRRKKYLEQLNAHWREKLQQQESGVPSVRHSPPSTGALLPPDGGSCVSSSVAPVDTVWSLTNGGPYTPPHPYSPPYSHPRPYTNHEPPPSGEDNDGLTWGSGSPSQILPMARIKPLPKCPTHTPPHPHDYKLHHPALRPLPKARPSSASDGDVWVQHRQQVSTPTSNKETCV